MQYTIEFDIEKRYAIITTSGKATVEGFLELHHGRVNHPAWTGGMNLLLDHRQLDSTALSTMEVQRLAALGLQPGELSRPEKIATVVETDLGFGLTRMWEGYVESRGTTNHRIFRSLEAAKKWIEEDVTEDDRGST